MINQFKEFIAEESKKFSEDNVKIISHLDSDGIASAAILVKLCELLNKNCSVSIVTQLDNNTVIKLSKEEANVFIFSDIGSSQISLINSLMSGKKIFVLDHHKPEEIKRNDSVVHINPHLFGIDGSSEISGAGVAYLFARALHEGIKDYAYIPIIGAIGDIQEKQGFTGVNLEILQDAVNSKKLRMEKGLRIFGIQTRPIHKLLEYCQDFTLPGITGSESGAVQFLQETGINPKKGTRWKRFSDLTGGEIDKLVTGLIMKRRNEKNPESIIGIRYLLVDEKHDSPFYDLKEFSTVLNSCGRLKKASLGIGSCLGDEKSKRSALRSLTSYKKEIKDFMHWFSENRKNGCVIEGSNYVIINAKDEVPYTMIGTMSSIIAKSRLVKPNTFILGMARQEGKTKISLRVSTNDEKLNLRNLIIELVEKTGGEAGGHQFAAGAVIDSSKEEDMISIAKTTFKNSSVL